MKNISKKIIIIISTFSIVLSFASIGKSQVKPDLGDEGHPEQIILKNDTMILRNTHAEHGHMQPHQKKDSNIGASASMYFSSNSQIYYTPISYVFFEKFKVGLSIPYISRNAEYNGDDYETNGLGDIVAELAYRLKIDDSLYTITDFKTSFPTGDASAEDDGYWLPLGNGCFSISPKQTISKSFSSLRIFGSIGIVKYFESKYAILNIKYKEQKNIVFSGMLGIEYKLIDLLSPILKLSYINVYEGETKEGILPWIESDDAMETLDVIPGFRINIIKDTFSSDLLFIIPVYTKYDSDVDDPAARNWGISFSADSTF